MGTDLSNAYGSSPFASSELDWSSQDQAVSKPSYQQQLAASGAQQQSFTQPAAQPPQLTTQQLTQQLLQLQQQMHDKTHDAAQIQPSGRKSTALVTIPINQSSQPQVAVSHFQQPNQPELSGLSGLANYQRAGRRDFIKIVILSLTIASAIALTQFLGFVLEKYSIHASLSTQQEGVLRFAYVVLAFMAVWHAKTQL